MQFQLPPRVRGYIDAIAESCNREDLGLRSILLFGSAFKGGFTQQVSDVDLIVVLLDAASREERRQVRDEVSRLETEHGLKLPGRPSKPLQAFAEHIGGEDHSCFVCTQSDLLSGEVKRVFDLSPAEAFFVDRIVFANVVVSSATVWGDDLLPLVQPPQVRRLDSLKGLVCFYQPCHFEPGGVPAATERDPTRHGGAKAFATELLLLLSPQDNHPRRGGSLLPAATRQKSDIDVPTGPAQRLP